MEYGNVVYCGIWYIVEYGREGLLKTRSNVGPFYGAIIFLILFYHRLGLLEQ